MVDKTSREPTLREVSAWLGQEQEPFDPPAWAGLDEVIRSLDRSAHWELVKHALYLRAMGIVVTRESAERMIEEARRSGAHRQLLDVQREERRTVATVYYIRIGRLVKIGQAVDVKNRIRAYPPDSVLLATEIGERDTLEAERHQQFKSTRLSRYRREWFHPSAELIEHINSLRDEPLTAAELAA